jgi:hypothetical protein
MTIDEALKEVFARPIQPSWNHVYRTATKYQQVVTSATKAINEGETTGVIEPILHLGIEAGRLMERERIATLEAALKPFAAHADSIPDGDNEHILWWQDRSLPALLPDHLRAAKKALEGQA